jgi:hypothetical protein
LAGQTHLLQSATQLIGIGAVFPQEWGSYDPAASPAAELYFSAGPDNGAGGLFGYHKPVATELTVGNDQ